jgi:hypothetical protein
MSDDVYPDRLDKELVLSERMDPVFDPDPVQLDRSDLDQVCSESSDAVCHKEHSPVPVYFERPIMRSRTWIRSILKGQMLIQIILRCVRDLPMPRRRKGMMLWRGPKARPNREQKP